MRQADTPLDPAEVGPNDTDDPGMAVGASDDRSVSGGGGMAVGPVTSAPPRAPTGSAVATGDGPPTPGGIPLPRRTTRWLVVGLVVAALAGIVAWWPAAPPPALLPDAVGATPRAPAGPVAWRWTLPQEAPVQHLDVVDDALVVLDLDRSTPALDVGPPDAMRLRLVDLLTGTTRWEHRLLGNEAVVVVDGTRPVTSVVPSALGNPVVVVGVDADTGNPTWRTPVVDLDGISTEFDGILVHGGAGCLLLDPSTGIAGRRLDGGRCLPWGTTLAVAGADGWQAWLGDEPFGPPLAGPQPAAVLGDDLVGAQGPSVVATGPEGHTTWTFDLGEPIRAVRPFPGVGVRADGPDTSTVLGPGGTVVARIPWWYRGILVDGRLLFLDVPPALRRGGGHAIRVVAPDGQVVATTGLRPGAADEPPGSASAAVASRVGPSMFCPTATVACRARRWPAVRLTADGVVMEHDGAVGLHGLDDLAPRWQVDLRGARVTALAADRRGIVALVTGPDGRSELRGFA